MNQITLSLRAYLVLRALASLSLARSGGIGKSGVHLFFVLSAMLLTSQMLAWSFKEYQMPSKWFFYFQRRVFRIWPLFLFVLLVSLLSTLYGPVSLAGHGLPVRIEPEMLIPALVLGKISYSLYVWHLAVVLPVFWFIPVHPLVKGWTAVSGAILLASVSFYVIERPVLRWSASIKMR